MTTCETHYADADVYGAGYYEVKFLNAEGVALVRYFDSPYLARKFINKVKRSKKLTLISYPLFY